MNQQDIKTSLEEIHNFKGSYPKQIWFLFFSEMWERFSFYGMRGMLVIFMVSELLLQEKEANLQYGAIQAFVYAFTFIGGLFADKILGFRKSLFWGGLLMIVGSFLLGFNPHDFFYIGICFTIIGTGFFKPNISTMVGALYREGDPRRDAGFGLFYTGINLGALIGGAVCVYVGKFYSWNLAFSLAGVVMIIGLLTFIFTQKSLGPIGISPLLSLSDKTRKTREWMVYVGSILMIPVVWMMVTNTKYTDYFMYTIGPLTLIYLVYEMRNMDRSFIKKMIAAIIFAIFSIIFWAFFEQSGGSLSLFALNNLNDKVLGLTLDPNAVNNSSNSLFIVALSWAVGLIWLFLARKKLEPNGVIKFGLAFLFLGGGFFLFYYTQFFAGPDGKTSLDIFTIGWLVITFGELCLSPIGMSLMTKLSPQRLWGVMMGLWFLASAYGQYFAGLLGANIAEASENMSNMDKLIVYTDGYKQLGIYALIAGVILILISPLLKKLMQDVK